MGMPSLPLLPGTLRWVLSGEADVGLLEEPAVGRDAEEEPVACWYDGGGSAGICDPDIVVNCCHNQ